MSEKIYSITWRDDHLKIRMYIGFRLWFSVINKNKYMITPNKFRSLKIKKIKYYLLNIWIIIFNLLKIWRIIGMEILKSYQFWNKYEWAEIYKGRFLNSYFYSYHINMNIHIWFPDHAINQVFSSLPKSCFLP